ncbi:LysR family transcriptional regulator [Pantoea sp. 18069]|uniref:LysR family transcriptional regulator n=1 Tax=Pantoea sp. 18069 TaxID=2681415 RepID=UPI001F24862C|nr:LysR family transcriptional regulator [Pantoea sp. 18069]
MLADSSLLLRLRMRQLLLIRLLDAERHMGRAAAALNVSQPAATKLLAQAEEVLGERLFERLPRGMLPTPCGEVIAAYARTLLVNFSSARESMAALRSGLSGMLRIASVPGAVNQLVAPALAEFKRRHPQVKVSVVVETSDVLVSLLERGEADLVLGRLTEAHDRGDYAVVPLLEEALVVVVRQSHPFVGHNSVSLTDLSQAAWVVQPPGTPQRTRFDAALREAGITRKLNTTETSSTVMTTALLEVSDMVAVMPESLAQHYGRMGVLRALPLDVPMRVPAINLITSEGRPLSAVAAQFVTLVQHLPRPAATD